MHLGVNCSILDGWWPEGFDGKNGFAIVGTPSRSGAAARDQADAEALYTVLEDELIPEFFSRAPEGTPNPVDEASFAECSHCSRRSAPTAWLATMLPRPTCLLTGTSRPGSRKWSYPEGPSSPVQRQQSGQPDDKSNSPTYNPTAAKAIITAIGLAIDQGFMSTGEAHASRSSF